ncbi:MAG: hypothetical protein KIH10_09690, partial [Candidatus Freyarchaeota archaeon]|nr:hypothetical protein [Candidatus Jordarchaeia archaeon]
RRFCEAIWVIVFFSNGLNVFLCLYLLDIFISLKNWELGDKKPRKPTKGFPNPRKMGFKLIKKQ